jgi:hypothetical protein
MIDKDHYRTTTHIYKDWRPDFKPFPVLPDRHALNDYPHSQFLTAILVTFDYI